MKINAKILRHQMSDHALQYNEHKCEMLKGEILFSKNFASQTQDINVLKLELAQYVFGARRKLKEPYFHAVLSCKGDEYDFGQLTKVGEEWMEKMGYGKQPYIVYGHHDTENNHIHIVSIRVDVDGRKIDDTYERLRSQKAIQEILNKNPKEDVEALLHEILSYNFSTLVQFRTLVELQGYKTRKHSGNIDIIKYGRVQKSLSISKLEDLIMRNEERVNEQRKRQISAILYKYSVGKSETELTSFLKTKFNIDIVFYRKKGVLQAYGYTVVDNSNKSVYSGNALMPIVNVSNKEVDEYIATLDGLQKVEDCNALCKGLLKDNPNIDYCEFDATLRQHGYKLYQNGVIYVEGFKITLKSEVMRRLRYNGRVKQANAFRAKSEEEAFILCQIYKVKYADIVVQQREVDVNRMLDYIKILNEYSEKHDANILSEKGLSLYSQGEKFYLIDSKNMEIIPMREFEAKVKVKNIRKRW